MRQTRYRIDVELEDVGEYDATFLAECVRAIARVVGNTGAVGSRITSSRRRPDDPT